MRNFSGEKPKRPELELFTLRLFTPRSHFHSFCGAKMRFGKTFAAYELAKRRQLAKTHYL